MLQTTSSILFDRFQKVLVSYPFFEVFLFELLPPGYIPMVQIHSPMSLPLCVRNIKTIPFTYPIELTKTCVCPSTPRNKFFSLVCVCFIGTHHEAVTVLSNLLQRTLFLSPELVPPTHVFLVTFYGFELILYISTLSFTIEPYLTILLNRGRPLFRAFTHQRCNLNLPTFPSPIKVSNLPPPNLAFFLFFT